MKNTRRTLAVAALVLAGGVFSAAAAKRAGARRHEDWLSQPIPC